jgi:hypothetical protein
MAGYFLQFQASIQVLGSTPHGLSRITIEFARVIAKDQCHYVLLILGFGCGKRRKNIFSIFCY